MCPLNISLIITTYNRPDALALVLHALAAQTRQAFEVVIADDGSTPATTSLIKHIKADLPFPLQHFWQPDAGFRAAKARNRAVALTQGDYLIFLDGDCVPLPDFVDRHCWLAESGWFVAGNRLLLSDQLTAQITHYQLPIWEWSGRQWLQAYLRRDLNRLLPLWRLPRKAWFRKRRSQRWQGAKTCNLAVWRSDLLAVNGFEEQFEGWGHEDAELVVRLLRHGVQRKEGRFAVPVVHLWHPEQDRSQEPENQRRLQAVLQGTQTVAKQGIAQYL